MILYWTRTVQVFILDSLFSLFKFCLVFGVHCSTVKMLLQWNLFAPNSGHLPYSAMYQLRFPYILYFKNLRIADTSE